MELRETIGIIEYVRENDRDFYEGGSLEEIRNLMVEILYELKSINVGKDYEDYINEKEQDSETDDLLF